MYLILLYKQHFDCFCVKGSYTIVDFYLFNNGAVDMQIWSLLRRSQCKISDTKVTIEALGPFIKDVCVLSTFVLTFDKTLDMLQESA